MRTLRVQIEDPSARRSEEHVFFRSPVRIGRSHLNDLRLDAAYVSQYHSVLSFDDEDIDYLDLGSTNGSFLDGTRVKAFTATQVQEGEALAIGAIRLKLRRSEESPSGPAAAPVERTIVDEVEEGTVVDPGALKQVRQAQTAVESARRAYDAYRAAWNELRASLRATLGQATPQVRALAVPLLRQAYPELANEPEYRELLAELGLFGADAPNTASMHEIARLLGFSDEQIHADQDGSLLLRSVAEVLEAFSTSFVELRRGLDQFSNDVAVRAFSRQTPLHTAQSGRDVLAYLVARAESGKSRVDELKGAFADIMIHQVALITGIMEGVRSMLKRLGPSGIAADLVREPEVVGPFPIRKGVWPFSVTALWQRFCRLHTDLVEEDRGVSEVLFGREFARSYGAAKLRHGVSEEPSRGSRGDPARHRNGGRSRR